MPDPFANEHAIYDADFSRLYRLFHNDPVDWPELSGSIDRALRNPALPRTYRGHYEAMRALDPNQQPADAMNHFESAKVMAEGTRLAYQAQGKDNAWIKDLHAAMLEKLIAVIEKSGVGDEADLDIEADQGERTERTKQSNRASETTRAMDNIRGWCRRRAS